MLIRRNLCLLCLLLGLLALELVLRGPLGSIGSPSELFPGFEPEAVGSIAITSGDQSVHLEQKGGLWVVRERDDFFAEEFLVDSLLKRLPDLNTADGVAAEASSQRLYGLGQGATQVQLSTATGEPLLGFRVGRPDAQTQGSYVLPDGQQSIYRAASLALPRVDPALWLNLHLIAGFDMTQVQRVELGFQDGRKLNLQKLDNGRWNAVGLDKSLAPTQVQHLMSFAMNAVLRDVCEVGRAEAGLELPRLSLTFFLEKGLRRLDLGAALGQGRAASSPDWGSDWVVEVPLSTAESLERTAAQIYSNLHQE